MKSKKVLYVVIQILFGILFLLYWSCSSHNNLQKPDREFNDQDLRQEISREWEDVQTKDTLIATMLTQSLALLMMEKEYEIDPAWLQEVGYCFYGLIIGQQVSGFCKVPIELIRPVCPCPDPLKDCDTNWNPKTYLECVGEAIRCRINNIELCQGKSLGDSSNREEKAQENVLRKNIVNEWNEVQEKSPLIANMFAQSLTLLMMRMEYTVDPDWFQKVSYCFYGLLSGVKLYRNCIVPIELLKPICPCPDPQINCDPSLFPEIHLKCVGEALKCRAGNIYCR